MRLCSWWNYLALELLAVSVACTALFCAWYTSALESGSALELASVGFTVLCVPRTLALVGKLLAPSLERRLLLEGFERRP